MTFLELVKRLRQECAVAGTGPTTVIDQVGQMKRLVDWTSQAWLDIQGSHDDWTFLREDFSFNTVASLGEYTPFGAAGVGVALSDWRFWHKDTFRCYRVSDGVAGEQWLTEWDYKTFRDTYRFGTQVDGTPMVFAQRPVDGAIMLGQKPDGVFTVYGEYQRKGVTLAADTDVPEIADHLHMVIVWHAILEYGLDEAAPEVIARAQAGKGRLLPIMEREYLPNVGFGAPLA